MLSKLLDEPYWDELKSIIGPFESSVPYYKNEGETYGFYDLFEEHETYALIFLSAVLDSEVNVESFIKSNNLEDQNYLLPIIVSEAKEDLLKMDLQKIRKHLVWQAIRTNYYSEEEITELSNTQDLNVIFTSLIECIKHFRETYAR